MHENIRHRYTTIVSYRSKNTLYDRCYTTCRSFHLYDIRYKTNLCECRVAGPYRIMSLVGPRQFLNFQNNFFLIPFRFRPLRFKALRFRPLKLQPQDLRFRFVGRHFVNVQLKYKFTQPRPDLKKNDHAGTKLWQQVIH